MLFTFCSMAQDITVNENTTYISCQAENEGYTNIRLVFNKSSYKGVIRRIKKYARKATKWSKKAKNKNKSDFEKSIPGYLNYNALKFSFRGVNHTSNNSFIIPIFKLKDGESYLMLRGYYEGYDLEKTEIKKKKTKFLKSKFNFNFTIPVDELDQWIANFEIATLK